MAKKILELFGYAADDSSNTACAARVQQTCPLVGGLCAKEIGSADNRIRCSVRYRQDIFLIVSACREHQQREERKNDQRFHF